MKVYMICMMHKRTIGYLEVIEIYNDKQLAESSLLKLNKDRPYFSQFILKEYAVKR